jgi:6-phosphofructokinase 1
MLKPEEVVVKTLGKPEYKSPLNLSTVHGQGIGNFVQDDARVRYLVELFPGRDQYDNLLFEKAGPREYIFFNPAKTKAAIVTCGGLCPGLNNVIRSIFLELYYNYGVKDILGIQYGYQGLNPAKGKPPIKLTPEFVEYIHKEGGTVLGSSRGPEEPKVIVEFLDYSEINILFCIGGDGTQRGTHDIAEEIEQQSKKIAVVGIPKTIDNDIPFVWKSFGFTTAVDKAKEVLDCAHMEAKGAPYGIGLVKLMGRDAGFIAATATLASQEVNFTLIPEVPFELYGEGGFLNILKKRILSRGHAVIVIAEGAGQDLLNAETMERDASGNIKHPDIGIFLRDEMKKYFDQQKIPANIKYFDPSYIIRSVPANGDDSLFCNSLARHAVHAAMAGKTDMIIGLWHNVFIDVPIPLITSQKKRVSPESGLWMGVIEATGQPRVFKTDK